MAVLPREEEEEEAAAVLSPYVLFSDSISGPTTRPPKLADRAFTIRDSTVRATHL